MPEPAAFTWLERPATMECYGEVQQFLLDGARQAPLSEELMWKFELVLEELVVNVIRHAYPPAEPGWVRVGYATGAPGELWVQIRHGGMAFDPLQKTDPDLTLGVEERPVGGLGIYLVKQMVNEITYQRMDDTNVLSLRMLS